MVDDCNNSVVQTDTWDPKPKNKIPRPKGLAILPFTLTYVITVLPMFYLALLVAAVRFLSYIGKSLIKWLYNGARFGIEIGGEAWRQATH